MNKYQKGFSLLELFISLAIGLVLFAGVMSIFVGMKTTTSETSSLGALQENGRFALSVLTDDLLREGFWGDMPEQLTVNSLIAVPNVVGTDCVGEGLNNGTFPQAIGYFRSLWGTTATGGDPLGCFAVADAKIGSDVIQIKRLLAAPLTQVVAGVTVPATNVPIGNFYLVANAATGSIFAGGAVPAINNAQVWQYQHHVYYIREEAQGSEVVPVLVQGQLSNSMFFRPLIDGIEMIRFMYGVDADNDGAVDAFISSDNMTTAFWDKNNDTNILSVKIYVLARDILPDNKYQNMNTYQLGDLSVNFITDGVGDGYRRLLLTSTVTLYNARVDTWP